MDFNNNTYDFSNMFNVEERQLNLEPTKQFGSSTAGLGAKDIRKPKASSSISGVEKLASIWSSIAEAFSDNPDDLVDPYEKGRDQAGEVYSKYDILEPIEDPAKARRIGGLTTKNLPMPVNAPVGRQRFSIFPEAAEEVVAEDVVEEVTEEVTDPTQGLLDVLAYGEGATTAKLQRQAKLGIGTTAYDMVYGYGSVVAPSKPVTEMTLAEVEEYQKELINATKGTLPKTEDGTSAVGKYQVLRSSLFGSGGSSANPQKDSWAEKLGLDEDTVFSPEIQEKIGRLALKETGYDNYMAGKKSQADTLQSIADMWVSVEGSTAGQGTYTSKKKIKGFLELVKLGSGAPDTSLRPKARVEGLMSDPRKLGGSEGYGSLSVIKEINAAPTTDAALDIVTDVVAKKDPLLIKNPIQWIYGQPNLIGLTEDNAEGQDTIVAFFSSSLGRPDQREYVTEAGLAKAGEGHSVTTKSGAWCATFVDHVLTNLGMDRLQNNKDGKKTNYARVGATHYQTLGKGVKLSETKAGDLAVFDAHVGFVVGKVDGIATSDKGHATALQEGLTKAGFSTKGIDGLWGPNSAKALASYQKAKGLQVTGNVTPETFKSLTNKEGKVTTNVLVLGGNQADSVNVTSYPASKINNFRRVGPVQDLDDKTFKAVTADIQKAGSLT